MKPTYTTANEKRILKKFTKCGLDLVLLESWLGVTVRVANDYSKYFHVSSEMRAHIERNY